MRLHGLIALVCGLAGSLFLGLGSLLPAHVRALDRDLLAAAGKDTPSLGDVAAQAVTDERLGTATLLFECLAPEGSPSASRDTGLVLVQEARRARPELNRFGGPAPWLQRHLGASLTNSAPAGQPVLAWAIPESSRAALLRALTASSHPTVLALLGCRKLERTELFPPVRSAAGQPLDAAILVACALAEVGRAHSGLALEWERTAAAASQGRGTLPFERAMLDLLSAARWLDWDQLASLTERCEDTSTLAVLASTAGTGNGGRNWGPLLAATALNAGARGVAELCRRHGPDGLRDLREALVLGTGAVQLLAREGSRIHHPTWRTRLVAALRLEPLADWILDATRRGPHLALAVKYLLWLDGLFLVLLALWHARRQFIDEAIRRFDPRPDWRVLGIASLAACILLFLAVEQYLVLKRPPGEPKDQVMPAFLRARFRPELPKTTTKAMNERMIAMLVAFFVIQLTIYLTGVARLRHLRGRLVDSEVKLKLIDNEEALFDAPLYMGIAGSVLALVLRLTGFEGVSLMASYSSTLFGILFCFILKVMHVRPYRQRLILEIAENSPA